MKDTSKNINGWDIDTLLSILAPGYDSDDRPQCKHDNYRMIDSYSHELISGLALGLGLRLP